MHNREPFDPRTLREAARDPKTAVASLLRFAILAPSSHNTQPWLFRPAGNGIEVFGDGKRMLPASDASHRQFFISIGCTIENIMIAADYYGLSPRLDYFPDIKKPLLAARIKLSFPPRPISAGAEHLIFAIPRRHSNREPFSKMPITEDFLARLAKLPDPGATVKFISDSERKQLVAKVVGDATEAAFHDKGFCRELSHWIKPSLRMYHDGMPGYNIGIPWLASFIVPLAIRFAPVAKQQRKMVDTLTAAAPVFGIITSQADDPAGHLAVGRSLERIWLTATLANIKLGFFAAPVEIGDFYRNLQDAANIAERPEAIFRLGYADKIPPPSPRRGVENVLIS